jgi:hypothetical protein
MRQRRNCTRIPIDRMLGGVLRVHVLGHLHSIEVERSVLQRGCQNARTRRRTALRRVALEAERAGAIGRMPDP